MTEEAPGFLERLFSKVKRPGGAARAELKITRPTVGLCFDYEPGVAYGSEYFSQAGLELVLKALQDRKLRATFLCPAKLCETAAGRVNMIADAGHELAILGYAGESPRDLTDDALKQMLFTCRNAFAGHGRHPIGFRSPESHWDARLVVELPKHRFLYSAEHDHAKRPYLLRSAHPPLVRIPIYTDDRHLRSRQDKRDLTIAKHHRVVRKAVQGGYFAAVSFHPWILAEEPERMRHWEEWLETALQCGATPMALEDVLPAELCGTGVPPVSPPTGETPVPHKDGAP